MTKSVEDLIGPLNEIERKYAPRQLWVAGDLSIFSEGRIVSVVGSRRPSPEGVLRTRRLVSELIRRHIAVLSGLALGVDTVAHVTAMQCGGRTVAVLGTPLDQATPGTTVQKWFFTSRNRTMALLSPATVIVEAHERSGTKHQGWEAIRLGRPLYFLKSAVDSTQVEWIHEQLKYGAEILGDDNVADVLDAIPTRVPIPTEELEEVVPF